MSTSLSRVCHKKKKHLQKKSYRILFFFPVCLELAFSLLSSLPRYAVVIVMLTSRAWEKMRGGCQPLFKQNDRKAPLVRTCPLWKCFSIRNQGWVVGPQLPTRGTTIKTVETGDSAWEADNRSALPPARTVAIASIQECGFEVVQHPNCSPDLAP